MPRPKSAEVELRAAFERLKRNEPVTLPRGTVLTQNNVAREAGRDPSAFRKARYPELIRDVQAHLAQHSITAPPSKAAETAGARRRSRELKQSKETLQIQFDAVAAELLAARAKVLELTQTVARLEAQLGISKVVPIRSR